ncbi:MAG: hypothetical protein AMXMBFR77_08120 [Phycisphaerales bacterium]|nr:hypothetical protein [Leptolyngbya sp.]GIK18023.1 MAG: hypothetical protein BroJett004_01870 [Planctomycetota bacterium]
MICPRMSSRAALGGLIALALAATGCGYSAAEESMLLRGVVFQPLAGDGSSIEPVHARRAALLRNDLAAADRGSLDSIVR